LNLDFEKVQSVISIEKSKEILEKNSIFNETWEIILQGYSEYMTKAHLHVDPMNENALKEVCQKLGKSPSLFKFNTVSNLLKNACMAKDCPYYMMPSV